MTGHASITTSPMPATDTVKIWRNNALMAGGTMLATAIMADAAQTLTTAAMGSGAISVDIIGFGAGAAVMLGASCLESRLAHSDGFSIRMGIISGLVTATTLRRFCKYPTAITFGALGAAAVAGRLALEIKRLVPDNSPE